MQFGALLGDGSTAGWAREWDPRELVHVLGGQYKSSFGSWPARSRKPNSSLVRTRQGLAPAVRPSSPEHVMGAPRIEHPALYAEVGRQVAPHGHVFGRSPSHFGSGCA